MHNKDKTFNIANWLSNIECIAEKQTIVCLRCGFLETHYIHRGHPTTVGKVRRLSWEGAASALQLRSSPATLNLNAALYLFVLFCVIVVLVCFCPCRSWPFLCYCCLFVCLFVSAWRPLFEIFTQPTPQGHNSCSKSLQHDQCNATQLRQCT